MFALHALQTVSFDSAFSNPPEKSGSTHLHIFFVMPSSRHLLQD
jgi:hypothetical protein